MGAVCGRQCVGVSQYVHLSLYHTPPAAGVASIVSRGADPAWRHTDICGGRWKHGAMPPCCSSRSQRNMTSDVTPAVSDMAEPVLKLLTLLDYLQARRLV